MSQTVEEKVTVKSQIVAGLVMFAAMAYILPVNAGMMSDVGVPFGAGHVGTAMSTALATFAMGRLANLPIGLSTGMGMNAYVVYTICFGLGFTFPNALVVVLIDSIIFLILTKTGARAVVFRAIPRPVKMAIPAGIGLFIAFLGGQDAGLIVNDDATLVKLASFNLALGDATWADVMPMLITLAALAATVILGHDRKDENGNVVKKGNPAAVLIVMVIATLVYYLLAFLTIPGFFNGFWEGRTMNPLDAFVDWGKYSAFIVIREGFDFSAYLETHELWELIVVLATSGLSLALCDMFDTNGTLYGCAKAGNLMVVNPETGEEEPKNFEKAMEVDAWGTFLGVPIGVPPITSFVESGAAIAAGGKNGLTAITCAVCFLLAMFIAPIAQLIPAAVYAVPLIYVGILMCRGLKDLEWGDILYTAAPAFMTLISMPLTYSISYGIAAGLITYVIIYVFTGKVREIKLATWLIAIPFVIAFFTTH